jgi:anaerobic ribonucleoside-triphosphate reductase activating protein
LPVRTLQRALQAEASVIEGVTFLGGEPFEQAGPLALLAREARSLSLSVMIFSGHMLETLSASPDPDVRALLACTDVLVDGRYEVALPDRERRWVGSRNQRFHYLTSFYSADIEKPAEDLTECRLDLRIAPDGQVVINGWPEGWGALRRGPTANPRKSA